MAAEARTGTLELITPPLFWLEIGNRLARAGDLGDELALEAMLRAEALQIRTVDFGRPLLLRAFQLGRDHRLTMYDATYLAVAEAAGAPLFTLDQSLARAARSLGEDAQGDSRRLSEPAASYGHRAADRTSIAAIGQALAEMRKEYAR